MFPSKSWEQTNTRASFFGRGGFRDCPFQKMLLTVQARPASVSSAALSSHSQTGQLCGDIACTRLR